MELKDLITELKEKECYKEFKKKNPNSYFCAGFFILDLEKREEKIQLDFFLPNEEKMSSFEFPFTEAKNHEEKIQPLKGQTTEIKIDIDDLEKTCKEIIKKNKSKINPTKIIAIIKEDNWNLTCMDNHLGIIRINVNALTGEETLFDKGSLMDFMGIKKK